MSKAEDRALEHYPVEMYEDVGFRCVDKNIYKREYFIEGYNQAEKDLTDKAKLSSGWDGFYFGQGYKQAEKDLLKVIDVNGRVYWCDEIEFVTNEKQ